MAYKIKKLKSFDKSAFEADSSLYALSPKAADKYFEDYNRKTELIGENPLIFQVFEDDPYFRSAPLVYGYRLFYHVDEQNNIVILHRIIHGAMDLATQLQIGTQ
ncbi:MAG: type II toxin-antitoxin system RelE/ParE family toxin [Oscillospiraceae bacterium]|nr:type II toxin-antitoxin system RelE/ParE family toxin [Oscillospiraceae bacterium]